MSKKPTELDEKCAECGANKTMDEHGIISCPNCQNVTIADIINTQREWNKKSDITPELIFKTFQKILTHPRKQEEKEIIIAHDGIGEKDGKIFIRNPYADSQWDEVEHRQIAIDCKGLIEIDTIVEILISMAVQFQKNARHFAEAFKKVNLIEQL